MHLRIFCGIVLFVLICAAPSAAADARLAPEDFAILPWGGAPGGDEAMQGIKDCGFNLAGFVAAKDVPVAAKAGLKVILSDGRIHVGDDAAGMNDEEIKKRVRESVTPFKDDPNVYGYYLRDEPSATLYPTLGKFVAAVKEFAPNQRAYVNLFPIVVDVPRQGVATYEEYVEKVVTVVNAPFISYDHYALFADGSVRDTFWQNLDVVRKVAVKHNVPFWNIVLGNAHFHYAEPSQAGLLLQAYSTLAYGARGISYFTYFAPHTGNYRLAPVDQFGHKTPTWDYMRYTNLQIHALGPAYLKLKSTGVFHHPNVPAGLPGLKESRLVADISGGNFCVGEFDGPDGHAWLLIVNKDLKSSCVPDIKLKTPATINKVSPYTGHIGRLGGEDVWLAPGAGKLLELVPAGK